jgi:diguanylate cyclase (GGDEF)-like protein
MPEVVEQLAALTGFRDRDVLDVALAEALRDLLKPISITIARCVGEPGHQRWMIRAHLESGSLVASADPAWSEMASLPEISAFPDRAACLHGRQIHAVRGGTTQTYFPLITEREAIGVLQIESADEMPAEDLRTVGAILRLYGNFQSLLDYGERDTLTGLLNRKTFDDSFLRLTAQPELLPAPNAASDLRRTLPTASFWLGVLDIDHFKRVNDNFGHLIGDEVLLLMSRLMRTTFRFQDQLFRFGGEEFVVLMRCANEGDAERAFERLRSNVERYVFPQVGCITISVGFTELRRGDSPATAFERADKAVYYAKQNGRNQVRHHAALVLAGKLDDESRDSDVELF